MRCQALGFLMILGGAIIWSLAFPTYDFTQINGKKVPRHEKNAGPFFGFAFPNQLGRTETTLKESPLWQKTPISK